MALTRRQRLQLEILNRYLAITKFPLDLLDLNDPAAVKAALDALEPFQLEWAALYIVMKDKQQELLALP